MSAAVATETGRWLYGFVRPHLGRLAGVLALSLAASLLALAQPWITKILIDDGLVAGDYATVASACAAMLAAALAGAVLTALNRWHYITASSRILFALRASVYRHLQTLSPAFYTRMRGGDLMARLDGDLGEVQRFAVDSALALVNGLVVLVGAAALMLALSWQLSLVAFVLLPVQMAVLRLLRPHIETKTRDLRERASGLSSFMFDTLSAMKFIQSTGATAREAERLDTLQGDYMVRLRSLQMTNQAATAVPSLLTLVGTIAVFLIGGAMVIDNALSLGTLIAFTAYLARATGPVHTLLGLWVALKRAQVSLERVGELRSARADVRSPAQPRPLPVEAGGEVVFEHVEFRHGDGSAVLADIDARFPAGAKIAVAGASGAGKSTMIDLLQRHYDPSGGRILLDGVDLRELDLDELRGAVAVVAQETVLLPGSVADNIRYAAPEASDDDVAQAARRAGAHPFIGALPDGYATQVGTRGWRLSGGERQRIAIARALLQRPRVLILDEATSGVDTATERLVRDEVDRLFANTTRIVVSHRSTLTETVDHAFALSDGRLVTAAPASAEGAR